MSISIDPFDKPLLKRHEGVGLEVDPNSPMKTFYIAPNTEKERLIHRLKTGHYMGEYICFVCLKVALSDSSRGVVYPIITIDKLSTDTGISIDVIKGTKAGLKEPNE